MKGVARKVDASHSVELGQCRALKGTRHTRRAWLSETWDGGYPSQKYIIIIIKSLLQKQEYLLKSGHFPLLSQLEFFRFCISSHNREKDVKERIRGMPQRHSRLNPRELSC